MELQAAIRESALSAASYAASLALGVCARCCLRFACVGDSAIYSYVALVQFSYTLQQRKT